MAPERYESKPVSPSSLGEPLNFPLSKTTAPNRFLKAAMTERLSSWSPTDLPARGIPSPELINVYKRWGEGGYGLILTGNIMIAFDQLEAAGNPIIPHDPPAPTNGPRFEAFKSMAQAATAHGALCVGQVSHPGRQVIKQIQKNPMSASDVQLEGTVMGMEFAKPHAASQAEIDAVVAGFAHAAKFLQAAGYDGIELHAAHGYLLAQFLSPTTNRRTDDYGGSLSNRARIILEIARACRAATKDATTSKKPFMVGMKLNSVEFQDKGFSPDEARELCATLERAQLFDFIELSGGTYEQLGFSHRRDSTRAREAFFLDFAEQIVPGLDTIKVYVTGGLRTLGAMVEARKTVDGIGLARPACQEFDLPKRLLREEASAAVHQKLDQDNFGLTNMAAGTQIRMVGKDRAPFDGSDADTVAAFQADMADWSGAMKNDNEDGRRFGYVDVERVPFVPYGEGVLSTAKARM